MILLTSSLLTLPNSDILAGLLTASIKTATAFISASSVNLYVSLPCLHRHFSCNMKCYKIKRPLQNVSHFQESNKKYLFTNGTANVELIAVLCVCVTHKWYNGCKGSVHSKRLYTILNSILFYLNR